MSKKIQKEDMNYAARIADGKSEGGNDAAQPKKKYKFKNSVSLNTGGVVRPFFEQGKNMDKYLGWNKYNTSLPHHFDANESDVEIRWKDIEGEKKTQDYPGSEPDVEIVVLKNGKDITNDVLDDWTTYNELVKEVKQHADKSLAEEKISVSSMLGMFLEVVEEAHKPKKKVKKSMKEMDVGGKLTANNMASDTPAFEDISDLRDGGVNNPT